MKSLPPLTYPVEFDHVPDLLALADRLERTDYHMVVSSVSEIYELRELVADLRSQLSAAVARAEKAEAKNMAMLGYLERISCPAQTTDLLWWQVQARAALSETQQ